MNTLFSGGNKMKGPIPKNTSNIVTGKKDSSTVKEDDSLI
jgi:hypothetical protein